LDEFERSRVCIADRPRRTARPGFTEAWPFEKGMAPCSLLELKKLNLDG